MTPTMWLGLSVFIAMAGLVATVVGRSYGAGQAFGSMAESMKNMDKNLAEVVMDMKENTKQLVENSQKLVEHDLRIYNLEKGRAPDQRPGLDFQGRRRRGGGSDS